MKRDKLIPSFERLLIKIDGFKGDQEAINAWWHGLSKEEQDSVSRDLNILRNRDLINNYRDKEYSYPGYEYAHRIYIQPFGYEHLQNLDVKERIDKYNDVRNFWRDVRIAVLGAFFGSVFTLIVSQLVIWLTDR